MIRVKKENHRSWFMSNYYPCEFVMNGIRYKNADAEEKKNRKAAKIETNNTDTATTVATQKEK